MKIVPSLCLVLALSSPVFALRGTLKKREKNKQRQQRRGQEQTINRATFDYDETAPLPGSGQVIGSETAGGTGIDFESIPAPAPLFDPNRSPPLNTGPYGLTSDANLEAPTEWGALTEGPWVMDNYGLYGSEYRKNKSSKKSNGKNKDKDNDVDADELCRDFCADYIDACVGANVFFNPDEPRGAPARRRLIAGEQLVVLRLDGTTVFESVNDCLEACMEYPRPIDPKTYLGYREGDIGIDSIGDTFWCRRTHLDLALEDTTNFAAQVHCPFAAPDGGGLCINAPIISDTPNVNGTAYDFIRAGAETSRHLGYCQMYFNDIVADCTSAGIDDRTLPLALALIPMDTEIIILNNNVGKRDPITGNVIGEGITEIPSQLFRGLLFPEGIFGLYIDDGNIREIASDGFTALRNIQALSLNMQELTAIPSGMLANAPFLRDFSLYNTRTKPGQITEIPANLFSERPTIVNRVVISGHRGLTSLPAALFTDQDETLVILILSNNGFTNSGITTTMFQNLIALQIFDLSNNQFTTAEAGWFNGGWAISLRNIYLQENPITIVEDGIFDYDGCVLENVLLHDTDVISIPVGLFDFCQETLISYTVSPRV